MIAFLLSAALAAQQPQPMTVIDQGRPGPGVSVAETAAAAREAFRAWLAAEMAQCASGPQVARRRITKLRFDMLQPRLLAVLGQQGASDALADVIGDSEAVRFPDCPAPDVIDQRMADFERAVGRLAGAAYAGEMMPFRPAQ
jgi:hypothetical protein